ncbi:MAG: beta-galactosidase trimerization domain-containing protein [Clostridia bacterium]|nr:beta-galactosidase trimerization domain-containing protein [Clostridia bacterium]
MTEKYWYKDSYRRNLIDMHIPDWNPDFFKDIDPNDYVAQLKKANVDTAYIYTTSCVGLCNFPTKVGKMHEGLHGRDIIREITDLCRKNGIRPVLYINIWSLWAYENHPDWRCVSPDGQESLEYMFGQPGRYGVLCPNSPYQEYVLALVRELMEMYETDGLWIDMILWRTLCTCHHCQERFKAETGHEIPKTMGYDNPIYMQFLRKREVWISEFLENIKAVVYEKNPHAAVVTNSAYYPNLVHGMSLDYAKQVEYISGDSSLGPVRSFEAKLFNNITLNHPFEFLCSVMDPSLGEHSMIKTEEHLMQLMTSCIAHNGRNGFIDAIDPYGTLNPAVYTRMRKVYDLLDTYHPFLENEMVMCADVAVYTNFSAPFSPSHNGMPMQDWINSDHMIATKNIAARFVEENVPFDVITTLSLDSLDKYKVIALADAYVLSDKEVEALRQYVKNGGKLYVSGRCAIYDGTGNVSAEGRLSDVLGVRLVGETKESITYIRPTFTGFIPEEYTESHPLSVRTTQMLIETDKDVCVLGRLTLPIVNPADTTKFASAISDPPGKNTEYPSLVLHKYGKGETIYSASPIENLTGRDQRHLLTQLVSHLIGKSPAFISNAPLPVETVVYRQKESGNYVINLTNSIVPLMVVSDIELSVRIPEEITAFYAAPDRKPIPYSRQDDYIRLHIPRLHVFEMFVAEVQ